MRLRHIEVFHAIYVTGSITNAANFLHVSQPSVSKVLAHAEMQLGYALFDRVKGRLIPTQEAKLLFGEVDKVYKQIRSVRNAANNLKKIKTGNINIGLTPALGFDLVPQAIAQYQTQNPHVNINLQTMHNDEVQQALIEHKIDFALMFAPAPQPGISQQTITQSRLMMMYPNHYFPDRPSSITLKETQEHEMIGIWDSGPLGDLVLGRLSEEDISVHSNITVQTYFLAAQLVAKSMGICVVDEFTARGNLHDNVSLAHIDPPLNFELKALHIEDRALSQLAIDFLAILSQLAQTNDSD